MAWGVLAVYQDRWEPSGPAFASGASASITWFDGLGFVFVHTVVANVGRRHHHNLTMVARIGEDLLVAVHPRVEGDFTKTCPTASRRFALKHGAVCQDKHCRVFW